MEEHDAPSAARAFRDASLIDSHLRVTAALSTQLKSLGDTHAVKEAEIIRMHKMLSLATFLLENGLKNGIFSCVF
jgi:hypothetical protein